MTQLICSGSRLWRIWDGLQWWTNTCLNSKESPCWPGVGGGWEGQAGSVNGLFMFCFWVCLFFASFFREGGVLTVWLGVLKQNQGEGSARVDQLALLWLRVLCVIFGGGFTQKALVDFHCLSAPPFLKWIIDLSVYTRAKSPQTFYFLKKTK